MKKVTDFTDYCSPLYITPGFRIVENCDTHDIYTGAGPDDAHRALKYSPEEPDSTLAQVWSTTYDVCNPRPVRRMVIELENDSPNSYRVKEFSLRYFLCLMLHGFPAVFKLQLQFAIEPSIHNYYERAVTAVAWPYCGGYYGGDRGDNYYPYLTNPLADKQCDYQFYCGTNSAKTKRCTKRAIIQLYIRDGHPRVLPESRFLIETTWAAFCQSCLLAGRTLVPPPDNTCELCGSAFGGFSNALALEFSGCLWLMHRKCVENLSAPRPEFIIGELC